MTLYTLSLKVLLISLIVLFYSQILLAEDIERHQTFTVYTVEIQPQLNNTHISSTLEMPNISFEANITPAPSDMNVVSFEWTLSLTFDQHGRSDSHIISNTVEGEAEWTPNWGGHLAGGDVQVSLKVKMGGVELDAEIGDITITGENPPDSDVIDRLGGSPAVEIACWESGHNLNQFNSSGWPLFGAPNGWGIMQIDNPPSNCPLTEEVIWNWISNVDRGLCVINAKENAAAGYPGRVRQRGYPNATDFTEQQLLYETIQRYNGGSYWSWGESLDPPQGEQWIATPPNNYVENVLSTDCR